MNYDREHATARTSRARTCNESIFRELNEQLESAATGSGADVTGFVCECSSITCTTVLRVSLREDEEVRSNPTQLIVAPSNAHGDPTVEQVVARKVEYWVVEKNGDPGAAAGQLDPRT